MATPPDDQNKLRLINETMRQAESRLGAQLTAALAADARAMQFISFIAAITVFLISVALAALEVTGWPLEISAVAGVGVLGFILAGRHAYEAAKPVPFEFVGGYPSAWLSDIEQDKPLTDALLEQLDLYEGMLQKNRASMEAASSALRRAATTIGVTLLICGIMAAALWVSRLVAAMPAH